MREKVQDARDRMNREIDQVRKEMAGMEEHYRVKIRGCRERMNRQADRIREQSDKIAQLKQRLQKCNARKMIKK